jgi:acetyltransferase
MELTNFFVPKRVALIGASDHADKVGGVLMNKLLKFNGEVIPINPKHSEIFGVKCYKSVGEYKEKIELAIIAIPPEFILNSLEECGKKGINNVIIITAGFSETGNSGEEKKILDIAKKYGIRILGPNCFGICNPGNNFDCTFSMTTSGKGNIAFISQSGALWSYISDFSIGKFGFSGFASLGNMADLDFSDFIEYFSKDVKTKSIVLYIEKLKNGKRFIEVCKKCKKPIFAVKSGSSKEGEKAAFSHTGSLATDYKIYQGAFKQAGVELCYGLEEAFEKASEKKLVSVVRSKINLGNKVFIITNAGGAGALVSDYISEKGIKLVEIGMNNPLDLLGTAKSEDYRKALEIIDKKEVDSILVVITTQSMTDLENIAKVVVDFKAGSKKNVVALFLGESSIGDTNNILNKSNICFFNTLEEFRKSFNN